MTTFEEALTIVLEHSRTLGAEEVTLLDATGRVLAEEISAPWDIPFWDKVHLLDRGLEMLEG